MDGDLYKSGDTLSIVLTGDAWKEEEYGVKEYLGGPVHAYVVDSSPAGTYNVSFPNGKEWWVGGRSFEASILGAVPEIGENVGFKSISHQVEESALDVQEAGDHYKKNKIQPVVYIVENNLSYLQGNVIKYITRYKDKNGKEDLKKAKHYIDLILEMEYGDE